ncbi:hypothetical protein [Gemmatimonas sp.]|uniref:hypothetical protein n=1 Tax=Gemmatimonas sp. TaxID=1962908 RepID=UPI003562F51C
MSAAFLVRRAALVCVAVVTVVGSGCHRRERPAAPLMPVLPRIPRDAARFEIDAVDDSTATFHVFESRWVRAGLSAYVVDPAHRDALVARLTIIRRDSMTATALVTSQVARVTTDHFLLVPPPPTPWWRAKWFWVGTMVGGALGAGATNAIR